MRLCRSGGRGVRTIWADREIPVKARPYPPNRITKLVITEIKKLDFISKKYRRHDRVTLLFNYSPQVKGYQLRRRDTDASTPYAAFQQAHLIFPGGGGNPASRIPGDRGRPESSRKSRRHPLDALGTLGLRLAGRRGLI